MLLSRVLGAVGRFCISLGVLTLLFVAYQLWGTGILTAQAQDGLENDFETLLDEADELDPAEAGLVSTGGTDGSDGEPTEDTSELDAATAAQAARELELLSNLLWQPPGGAVAQMSIPDIGVEWTVVEGVGTDELRKGPGHYPGTPLPGTSGNAAIAGHRTTWGAPFNRIDELEPGARITMRTIQGTFEYRVITQESGKGHFIVAPGRVDVLDQTFTDHPNRLTLTACHPKFSARQRIIVVAQLIGEPAPTVPRPDHLDGAEVALASEDVDGQAAPDPTADTTLPADPDLDDGEAADESEPGGATTPGDDRPRPQAQPAAQATDDSFGEGLNGDRSAILPAVTWGLAAAAIAATSSFIGRRWRKWPSYAVGLTPFAIVLFVCFVHIDQAIPSY